MTKRLNEIEEIRKCTECSSYMMEGFTDEELATYYCSKICLNKSVPEAEQKEAFDDESLYWTDWYDDAKVFVIFDNQYASKEDAEFIQENHGNPTNLITVADYNLQMPIFTIKDGVQIETCIPSEFIAEALEARKVKLLETVKEIIGYKPVHTKSDEHAHYFTTTLLFDMNQELKIQIDNGSQWKVYSRYGDLMDWHLTEVLIDAETLEIL